MQTHTHTYKYCWKTCHLGWHNHACLLGNMFIYVSVYTHTYRYVLFSMYTYIHTYVFTHMRACMHVCIYVHACIHISCDTSSLQIGPCINMCVDDLQTYWEDGAYHRRQVLLHSGGSKAADRRLIPLSTERLSFWWGGITVRSHLEMLGSCGKMNLAQIKATVGAALPQFSFLFTHVSHSSSQLVHAE